MHSKTQTDVPWTIARLLTGALLGLSLAAAPAAADLFTVNDATDTDDGSCDPAPGDCTLREAIHASNASTARDTIDFDPTEFPLGAPTTINVASALPASTDPEGVVVDGYDAGVIVDGGALAGAAHGLVFQTWVNVPLRGVSVEGIQVQLSSRASSLKSTPVRNAT